MTLSDENAQMFTDVTVNEVKKIARNLLKGGYGRMEAPSTGADVSNNFLDSPFMKDLPERIIVRSIAEAAGLEPLYLHFYGYVSLYPHGATIGIHDADLDKELYVTLGSSLGFLECINVIASDWIVYRKQTPEKLLNTGLMPGMVIRPACEKKPSRRHRRPKQTGNHASH